ncbi:hypothetical protein [Streptomyces sp. LMG1-1-1.1]
MTSSAVWSQSAYDVGGDAYDHSSEGDVLHPTLLNAMDHDLACDG